LVPILPLKKLSHQEDEKKTRQTDVWSFGHEENVF